MDIKKVDGEKKGEVMMYALSTCVWCKKTKRLLNSLGIEYNYVDVDLLDPKEKEEAEDKIREWNPKCSFPTLVLNNETCIVGFKEDQIKEALGDKE